MLSTKTRGGVSIEGGETKEELISADSDASMKGEVTQLPCAMINKEDKVIDIFQNYKVQENEPICNYVCIMII